MAALNLLLLLKKASAARIISSILQIHTISFIINQS
jgi:hypothetical protein